MTPVDERSAATLLLRRPRLALLLVAFFLVAGLSALATLPRAEDPELTSRNSNVFTVFPGANAERVEALVTDKIEAELLEFEEIQRLESTSRSGISIVHIELRDDITDVDPIWSRIRDRLGDAAAALPPEAHEPDLEEFDIAAYTLIAALTWELDTELDWAVVNRWAEELQERWRTVSGTRDVELYGTSPEEIRIDLEPERFLELGLTPELVSAALAGSDARVPAGTLRTHDLQLTVEVEGEFDTLERIRRTPLSFGADGSVVRVADIATVTKAIRDPAPELALIDGKRGVTIAARMESDRRVDLWSKAALATFETFTADLPRGLHAELIYDQSRYTSDRLSGLVGNLMMGTGLVILVLFITMGWRSALLVGSALPLAVLMVLAGMKWLGVPLQQMSVTGLIIALGLLIDNAIVMVDEVRHKLAQGLAKATAVREAVEHLAVPLLGSTVTTVLAFMPIYLMPGPAGEFVGSMALSVVLALVSSLFLSLTIVPALTVWIERAGASTTRVRTGLARTWHSGIQSERAEALYRRVLGFMFANPLYGVAFGLALPLCGFGLAGELREQFFPPADRDQFAIELRLPRITSIEETERIAQAARELLEDHERVSAVHWFLGHSAPKFYYNMIEGEADAPFYGQALVQLEGDENVAGVINDVQPLLDRAIPGAQFIVKQLEQGPPFEAPIELRLYGPDLDVLRELGKETRAILAGVPGVTHTRTNLGDEQPKLWLATDPVEAERAGFELSGVARAVAAHLDGVVGGALLEGTEEVPVRVRLARSEHPDRAGDSDFERLEALELIRGPHGWVPLQSFGQLELGSEVSEISRYGGERVNTVRGYLQAGLLPQTTFDAFATALEDAGFDPPPGYRFVFAGESAERDDAVGNLLATAGMLGVLMVLTLVLSFHSFRLAGLILLVALLSIGLGQLALWFFGYPFGFMAIVGSMGLAGVAINDAIVVLTALRADNRVRRGDQAATVDIVVRASRHVFSTTLTTIVGFLPLWLDGGTFWPPVAVAIAGGVAGATLLAVTFVPASYLILRHRRRALPVVPVGPPPVPMVAT